MLCVISVSKQIAVVLERLFAVHPPFEATVGLSGSVHRDSIVDRRPLALTATSTPAVNIAVFVLVWINTAVIYLRRERYFCTI
ncbi:hypothetical protein C484_18697 [Natrialba taiwanensis DSM 12281]|uniref:Uncharacterized protein n=1 Tax=Natrialba taiwanensis DSM 12281 TaxID=1230458 RepID=L9ZJC1_9EURY|nr:hypothetical protein C484_18697 [Natrialba taiwanensis DSM 12281]